MLIKISFFHIMSSFPVVSDKVSNELMTSSLVILSYNMVFLKKLVLFINGYNYFKFEFYWDIAR